MKEIKPDVFRAYDIRGIVDEDFDGEWVETLGRACGTYFLDRGFTRAVVGRDCRHSSPEYQTRIIKGLMATGVDVTYVDMVATPLFYFAIKHLGFSAGVMITASHNPPDFNGFKVWAGDNTIHTDEIRRIYSIMQEGEFPESTAMATEMNIVPEYLEHLLATSRIKAKIKVVVDGGNGSAGEVCAELLDRAGAEVLPIYCEPDGAFPNHHPDPTVLENITDLRSTVVREKAHLGIGLDGDGDRIGVVDENGDLIYGDKLLAIFSREVLKEHPGETVIGEVKCSHLLFKDIKEHGGNPVMWKTGHSLIKARMKETGAVLAGEMSGHMFFADRYYGFDDALYAALRLCETVAKDPDKGLSSYLSDWPTTFNTPEIRVECPEEKKFRVVDTAREYFRDKYDIVDVDGVRITFDDGWALLRASNTQPVLVLRFEAESEQRLKEMRELVEKPLQEWIASG
ncbi:MAG: phosphomannomutase/phosphoglucomutase [Desulfonatronovibrionaceae bacterium]